VGGFGLINKLLTAYPQVINKKLTAYQQKTNKLYTSKCLLLDSNI